MVLGCITDPDTPYILFESFDKKDYKNEKIILEDGGVKANNPSSLGYEYFKFCKKINENSKNEEEK